MKSFLNGVVPIVPFLYKTGKMETSSRTHIQNVNIKWSGLVIFRTV